MYSSPLAYFITFRCYGTWLHGDPRGSVDMRHHDFDTPFLSPDARREQQYRTLMKHPEVRLNYQQRLLIASAIQETCRIRGWVLYTIAARTNHVHVVVGAGIAVAELVLNALKANATRELRQAHCWPQSYSPWSAGGSTRYLWKEKDLAGAIDYVRKHEG